MGNGPRYATTHATWCKVDIIFTHRIYIDPIRTFIPDGKFPTDVQIGWTSFITSPVDLITQLLVSFNELRRVTSCIALLPEYPACYSADIRLCLPSVQEPSRNETPHEGQAALGAVCVLVRLNSFQQFIV
jgi:hypothetical protein